MMRESEIDLRGCTLHVRRAGQGAPLLFLHGAQGLGAWPAALEQLAARFEVIAPDHPGFGRSDSPDSIDDVPDLAFFYLDLLAALGLSQVHLVGESIGGWIALEMTIRSTARLKSLTVASSAGIRVTGVPRADMFICGQEELAHLLFAGDGWKAWLDEWSAPERGETYDKNRVAAAKFTWQPRLFNPKLAKWLHRVDVPTHILWGAADRVIPPAHAAALKELIAGSTLTMLERCGHLPHAERPDLFADAVASFIERTAS
jgi:pimeloyl-ACP methyl ester carboxylesterase